MRVNFKITLNNLYTGIWWYAKYPNHYGGDGSMPNPEIGEIIINSRVDQLTNLIKTLKENDTILNLQDQFFKESSKPLETKQ